MIKLKQLLLEQEVPDIFIPRRIEGRFERMIRLYIKNGSKGDLILSELPMRLTKLPPILKDITVNGWFDCSLNSLTSLENCPKIVIGNFYCSYNNLTSLEFAPQKVDRHFVCHSNDVKFTEEQVRAVCDVKGTVYV
jgi:hypothetical protein